MTEPSKKPPPRNRKLYIERWLLEIKDGASAAGLAARLRALDYRGGKWLALDVRRDLDAIQVCYRKSRLGARMVAAATGAEIIGRLREVHARILGEHQRLLENGFRRFLRRSLHLLEALESAFFREEGLKARLESALNDVNAPSDARPAAVVRRNREKPGRHEVLPGAAFSHDETIQFAAVREGRLVELTELFPRKAGEEEEKKKIVVSPGGAAKVRDELAEITIDMIGLAAVDGAVAATEAVVEGSATGTGSCLADAACASIDCGGLDCLPF